MPHMSSLYRFAVGMTRDNSTAEDLVQETYKEAWKSFLRYTPGTDCKAWLFKILFRVWSKYSGKLRRLPMEEDLEQVPEAKLAVESDVLQKIECQEILQVLRSLPDHYQRVLILADVEELSYREISQLMEVPMGTVMSRLNRARVLVRQKLLQASKSSRSA